jgi:hypothetical protein
VGKKFNLARGLKGLFTPELNVLLKETEVGRTITNELFKLYL